MSGIHETPLSKFDLISLFLDDDVHPNQLLQFDADGVEKLPTPSGNDLFESLLLF